MKLAKLQMSGFKSFADTVVLNFDAHLTGILGPNGGGKSNILDAFRWTLGESRAASLRGDVTADMLFRGTQRRAGATSCFVEITLENPDADSEDHPNNHPWSKYPQIVVRREADSTGATSYSINNTKVRRRDVMSLFYGTGVSARSYGIIEQGMVTQIAEATPPQLQAFVDELAGVSQYKANRKMTESQLANTRENLARLDDILAEIRARITTLKRQASLVEKYQRTSAQIEEHYLARLARQADELDETIAGIHRQMEEVQQEFDRLQSQEERGMSDIKQAEARLAELTQQHNDLQYRQMQQQKDEEMLLEQLAHVKKSHEQLIEQQSSQEAELSLLLREIEQDNEQSKNIRDEIEQTLARNVHAKQEMTETLTAQLDIQTQYDSISAEYEEKTAGLEGARREIESLAMEHKLLIEKNEHIQRERTESVARSEQAAPPAPSIDESQIEQLITQQTQAQARLQQAQAAREAHQETMQQTAAARQATEQSSVMLAARRETMSDWTRNYHQQHGNLLAEQLGVRAGRWANALDAVLGRYALAEITADLGEQLRQVGDDSAGRVFLEVAPQAENTAEEPSAEATQSQRGDYLLDHIAFDDSAHPTLRDWLRQRLRHVRVAPRREEALQARKTLHADEIIVTGEGEIFGLISFVSDKEQLGGYAWHEQLRQIDAEYDMLQRQLAQQDADIEQQNHAREALEDDCARAQSDIQALEAKINHLKIEQHKNADIARIRQEQQRHYQAHIQRLDEQLEENRTLLAKHEQTLADKRRAYEQQEATVQEIRDRYEAMKHRLDETQHHYSDKRMHEREGEVLLQSLQQRQEAIGVALAERAERKDRLERRIGDIQMQVGQVSDARLQSEHLELQGKQSILAQEIAASEQQMSGARGALEELQQQNRPLTQTIEQLRHRLHEHELALNTQQVHRDQVRDSIEAQEVESERLQQIVAEYAEQSMAQLDEALEALKKRRDNIGSVNFLAVAERNECQERLTQLEVQHADIAESITILEKSVKKMDREIAQRLADTLTRLNESFHTCFAKIFAGGRAWLEMFDPEDSESGFVIRTQIPGKRNLPIKSLSGGEKTMTAMALVFAMMSLAPPPFSLLDEVDAALDDMMTARFCEMIVSLSQQFPIAIISHNQMTLHYMNTLIGVTQEEKGVSRIISVDLAEVEQYMEKTPAAL